MKTSRMTVRTPTTLGWVTVTANDSGLLGVTLPNGVPPDVEPGNGNDVSEEADQLANCVAKKLQQYFAGESVTFDEPLDFTGAPTFHQRVWRELRKVPRGGTISYGELARRAGRPGAARAVGRAMATNPFPVVVPCHRVLRSDGSLGGFGGGLELKRKMLELETDTPVPRGDCNGGSRRAGQANPNAVYRRA